MISRLAPLCGAEIPLSELFDRPNIAVLAELINARHNSPQQMADAALLAYVESLSDDEATALLARTEESPVCRRA